MSSKPFSYDDNITARLKEAYHEVLVQIGEDPTRDGLIKTPERAAKAMQYLTKGYRESLDNLVNNALFESNNEEMVIVKDIEFYSMCEHHMLPFFGKCHVGYLPAGKVMGLSKVARIVDMYARRLQIQEQLTCQIAEAISSSTHAYGVAVVMQASHMCMTMRGVEKQNSTTVTSAMLGTFRNRHATRAEFMELVSTVSR